jgi:hypothetical protein
LKIGSNCDFKPLQIATNILANYFVRWVHFDKLAKIAANLNLKSLNVSKKALKKASKSCEKAKKALMLHCN